MVQPEPGTEFPAFQARPLFPWMGGKRRLLPLLLPLLEPHRCYVEPFAGAAALFFAKEEAESEVLNDVNGELVNLYRVVQRHPEEFLRQFKWALSSRQIYRWQQMTPPETLTDIQRAARFYYLQRLAFGGKVDGQSWGTVTTGSPRLNLLRLEEELSAAHLRLSATQIEHLPWQDCAQRYDRPHTLTYCDPPYWDTAGYGTAFPREEYTRLARFAETARGRVIISVNDHPEMRAAFAAMPMRSIPITYTVGGGSQAVARAELIIGNWPNGWPAPQPLQQQVPMDL